jgi:hypothetical protein
VNLNLTFISEKTSGDSFFWDDLHNNNKSRFEEFLGIFTCYTLDECRLCSLVTRWNIRIESKYFHPNRLIQFTFQLTLSSIYQIRVHRN